MPHDDRWKHQFSNCESAKLWFLHYWRMPPLKLLVDLDFEHISLKFLVYCNTRQSDPKEKSNCHSNDKCKSLVMCVKLENIFAVAVCLILSYGLLSLQAIQCELFHLRTWLMLDEKWFENMFTKEYPQTRPLTMLPNLFLCLLWSLDISANYLCG